MKCPGQRHPKRLSHRVRCGGIAQVRKTVRYDEKYPGDLLRPIAPSSGTYPEFF